MSASGHPERVLMVGCGSIGQTLLPMLLEHFSGRAQFAVIAADEDGRGFTESLGIPFHCEPLTARNFESIIESLIAPGDLVVNVSVGVESRDLARFCSMCEITYVDTSIETWESDVISPDTNYAENSNYVMRESVLALKSELGGSGTAVLDHGANPGLVSHFFKQALIDLAAGQGFRPTPHTKEDWARLAQRLDVRLVQIAERDSQRTNEAKDPHEFVNTWSVPGFAFELLQPAELGFGTHERRMPADAGEHASGCRSGIFLHRFGGETQVRSWVPGHGPQQGFLISHDESLSIADYFSLNEPDRGSYRPTVQFAYRPCQAALDSVAEFRSAGYQLHPRQRVLGHEIIDGNDDLGVLVCGPSNGPYWLGSRLDIHTARRLVPSCNATSLQVAAGALAAVVWALDNPHRGIAEPDEVDFRVALDVAMPYLGAFEGHRAEWSPLDEPDGRGELDPTDPWQFCNLRCDADQVAWRPVAAAVE
ncbi:MAG TPA: saccharopine dehydrogenase NADP-binding domain-containing protein [Streptosporangiaceae bacterium]|nr:saccharopine dehydrogenase NADP-binding domain-containing protein [Streptosporangiaceae bacterium]